MTTAATRRWRRVPAGARWVLAAYVLCAAIAVAIIASGVPAVATELMVIGWVGGASFVYLLHAYRAANEPVRR